MEAAILSEDPLGGAHIGPLLVLLQPLQGQLERPVGVGAAAEAARASRPHSGARALARRADPAARHAGAAAYAARRSAAPALPMRSGDRSGTRALPPILLPDKLMRKGINMRVPSGHGHRACCARSGRGAPRGVRPADSSAGARLLRRKASSAVSDGADVLSSSSCTSPGPENAYR